MNTMTEQQQAATRRILAEVELERHEQHAKWGEQDLPRDVPAPAELQVVLDLARRQNDADRQSWDSVLLEEVGEAIAERAPRLLRRELVQVAAVVVQWIEALDRAHGAPDAPAPSRLLPQPPPVIVGEDRPVVLERLKQLAWELRPIGASQGGMGRLLADLEARAEQGRARYGCYLRPHNGRRMVVDEYQELLDAAMYRAARILEGETALEEGLQRILLTALEMQGDLLFSRG